jgi:tetratricopeptide (TPR) repeat protein
MRLWSGLGGLGPLRAAAFFGLCYLYVWLRIEPHLIFHVQEPVFFRGWVFFHGFTQVPGGVTAYVAALAGQAYAFGWLGALVILSVTAAIGVCARDYVRGVTGRRLDIVALAPVVLLLVLHNRYHYDLVFDLSLLAALAAASASTRLGRGGRAAFFVIAAPFLYWITGGGWLLFALLGAIREFVDRRPVAALMRITTGAALPWLATLTVYPGTLHDAYLSLLPLSGAYLLGDPRIVTVAAALYLFTPIAALLAIHSEPAAQHQRGRAWNMGRLGLALLGGLLIYGTFDVNHRTMLKIDFQARRQNWKSVLSEVSNLTAYDVLTAYNVQLALCHLGRLGSDLFAYPHVENAPIFLPSPEAPSRFLVLGDNLLELGYVNKAEHMLQEALEIHGDRPSILRRLVTVNVLKDRPAAARVYLRLLARSPLDRAWAEDYLAALEADPRRGDDAALNKLREVMIRVDYPGFFSPEDILRQLLDRNPKNLLAFDLLMGHYLQTAQPDKIVQNIGRLAAFPRAFPGTTLPRLYEEAVMLWATQVRLQTGTMPALPLDGRLVSLATKKRYGEFSQLLAAHKGDPSGARRELGKAHRDTFWYYYLYRGAETGVPIISRATQSVQ